MVDDFKHADKTKAHAKAKKSGCDWNKSQSGHSLVAADLGVVRISDEHLQDQDVGLGIVEQKLS